MLEDGASAYESRYPDPDELAEPLTFDRLRRTNMQRCDRWHQGCSDDWSLSDWATALAGEVGEACNIIKKLNRIRDGLSGNAPGVTEASLREELAKELADVQCYLDLLAARAHVDLGEATITKFNAVSEKHGFSERL